MFEFEHERTELLKNIEESTGSTRKPCLSGRRAEGRLRRLESGRNLHRIRLRVG